MTVALPAVELFEQMPESVLCLAPDGGILYVNAPGAELIGFARDELPGRNLWELFPVLVADPFYAAFKQVLATGENVRFEDFFAGQMRWFRHHLYRVGEAVIAIGAELTAEKRMEQDSESRLEELARTVRFSEMFVGMLGHDLRSPLGTIHGGATLLLRNADEEARKPVLRILSSAERMARMIDQLTDFTRIRLGQGVPISRELVDLAQLGAQVIDEIENARMDARVETDWSGDTIGMWDRDRLHQLLANLVQNAVDHGERRGRVLLSAD